MKTDTLSFPGAHRHHHDVNGSHLGFQVATKVAALILLYQWFGSRRRLKGYSSARAAKAVSEQGRSQLSLPDNVGTAAAATKNLTNEDVFKSRGEGHKFV